MKLLLVSLLGVGLIAACAHDPAHDHPIEPWASPGTPPTTQAGDDGGWSPVPSDAGIK
jgi:hypothetical protein